MGAFSIIIKAFCSHFFVQASNRSLLRVVWEAARSAEQPESASTTLLCNQSAAAQWKDSAPITQAGNIHRRLKLLSICLFFLSPLSGVHEQTLEIAESDKDPS